MRGIKFRAWDIPTKRMLPVVDLQFRLDYREDIDGVVSGVSVQDDGSEILLNYELMQYTGLKDKNGKEIYERDIIDTHFNANFSLRYRPVIFKNGAFQLDPNPDGLERFLQEPKEFEVVGNIYENPEFLE